MGTVGSNLGQVDIGRPKPAVREFSWWDRYTAVRVLTQADLKGEPCKYYGEGGG